MAVSSSTFDAEIGVVVVAILVVLVGLYALYRYLQRRGPELAAREGRGVLDDRAYNKVRIGETAAERLGRTGVDVSSAMELFRRAEAARLAGNFQSSLDLSKKGQDLLAAARSGAAVLSSSAPRGPLGSLPKRSPIPSAGSVGTGSSAGFTAPPIAPFTTEDPSSGGVPTSTPELISPRPPKNKMEARFQLSLAQDELDQARTAKSGSTAFIDAERLRSEGQAAHDRQDYTESLRLALKSRRTLGARIESLPLTPASTTSANPGTLAPAGPATTHLTRSSSVPSSVGLKCPRCGREASPVDQFCRGCGTPIGPVLCQNCAAPLEPGDRFCGKCGATQT